MNTGIDDAANLSWKLAAMVHGWGGASLVDLYELERKPVAERNTIAARELAKRNGTIPTSPAMEEDNAEGEAARRQVAHTSLDVRRRLCVCRFAARRALRRIADHRAGWRAAADNFRGTFHRASLADAPPYLAGRGRGRGSSLYDRLGIGFTLLRLGGHAADSAALEAAAGRRGIPLEVLDHPGDQRVISTSAIWCSFVPTSMWPGGQPAAPDPDMLWGSWSVPRSRKIQRRMLQVGSGPIRMSQRQQKIRFCASADGMRIAYATCGSGPALIWVQHWIHHLELDRKAQSGVRGCRF